MREEEKKELIEQAVIRGIKRNYYYGEMTKQLIRMEKEESQKLKLIEYLAWFYATHISGRYSDEFLENELIQIGKNIDFQHRAVEQKSHVLMVMTQAYEIGGHTTVVNNWIRADKSRIYSIVFTEGIGAQLPQYLVESVKNSGGHIYYLYKKEYKERAKELLELSDCFEKIILHIHMQDVVPILAYSNKDWHKPVYFFNHANFRFSLGISITDMMFHICDYDMKKAIKVRGTVNNHVLCCPGHVVKENSLVESKRDIDLNMKKIMSKKYGFDTNSRIIISMGADYKYKRICGYDFAEFVKETLDCISEKTYFFIIGADQNNNRWKKMGEETNQYGRALGTLPAEEVKKWMQIADVYVNCFPMSASGAFEARQNGVPAVAIDIIGRAKEFDDGMYSPSLNDMKKRICQIIKNNERFRNSIINKRQKIVTNNEIWTKRMGKMLDCNLQHTIRDFESKLIIGKEEIVNYQLLNGEEKADVSKWKKINIKNRLMLKLFAYCCAVEE